MCFLFVRSERRTSQPKYISPKRKRNHNQTKFSSTPSHAYDSDSGDYCAEVVRAGIRERADHPLLSSPMRSMASSMTTELPRIT